MKKPVIIYFVHGQKIHGMFNIFCLTLWLLFKIQYFSLNYIPTNIFRYDWIKPTRLHIFENYIKFWGGWLIFFKYFIFMFVFFNIKICWPQHNSKVKRFWKKIERKLKKWLWTDPYHWNLFKTTLFSLQK